MNRWRRWRRGTWLPTATAMPKRLRAMRCTLPCRSRPRWTSRRCWSVAWTRATGCARRSPLSATSGRRSPLLDLLRANPLGGRGLPWRCAASPLSMRRALSSCALRGSCWRRLFAVSPAGHVGHACRSAACCWGSRLSCGRPLRDAALGRRTLCRRTCGRLSNLRPAARGAGAALGWGASRLAAGRSSLSGAWAMPIELTPIRATVPASPQDD